ncbi:MAG: aldehyde dehydrogenase family protein, partial [Proteobacteria bacterium]|nr:aldehyde dehydrogenase family protein [Pseudomonadota bacterium]
MREHLSFYIGGAWVAPRREAAIDVVDPSTEAVVGRVAMGGVEDVDAAVHAARMAFPAWSTTSREERLSVLERVLAEYGRRMGDVAAAITAEMGAPTTLALRAQAPIAAAHLQTAIEVLRDYPFEEARGSTRILKEPIGVCGFITPWNWPMNQIMCKVAPALAVGCTMVLKPSEIAPFSAQILAEVMDAAGVPAGVFNLVYGDGATVGAAIAAHPGVDMVSFTGSTRAGVQVAKAAADTVKRVAQELGGKSPNIILDDADLPRAVASGVKQVMINSGQSCNAPTRMLVPQARMEEAAAAAQAAAQKIPVGPPSADNHLGPVVSQAEWCKI